MDLSKIEAYNPSTLVSYVNCPLQYNLKYEKGVGTAVAVESYSTLGTLFHLAAATYDAQTANLVIPGQKPPTELPWPAAVEEAALKTRCSPLHLAMDNAALRATAVEVRDVFMQGHPYHREDGVTSTPVFDSEAKLKSNQYRVSHRGGYVDWRRSQEWEVLTLETRYAVPLGDAWLAPKSDGAIRWEGKLYVLERKTTAQEDAKWVKKWKTNLQTTAECIAVEEYYEEECVGVLITPVVYSRKRLKDWPESGAPQPINKITFEDPRPIDKNRKVKQGFIDVFDDIVDQIRESRSNSRWPQHGIATGSCIWCDFHDVCWRDTEVKLFDNPPADLVTGSLVKEKQ